MWLYHATLRKNLPSIQTDGLKPGHHANWNDMYTAEHVFLAVNAEVAEDYVTSSPDYDGSEICILKVESSDLDQEKIRYDWNNRCEYHTDINSVAYKGNIPINLLYYANHNEPLTEIDDFKEMDFYWIIMDTFYEEVETNLEP